MTKIWEQWSGLEMRQLIAITWLGLAMVTLTGCNIVITDGYYFTKTGVEAIAHEKGALSSDISNLQVQNKHGKLDIRPADGEPRWTWEKKVWSDSEELAKDLLDELVLETITEDGSTTLRLILPPPTSDLNGIESNLTIWVPSSAKIDLANAHGDVAVANISESVTLDLDHGNAKLQSVEGACDLDVSHGDLEASSIGDLTADARHGNLTIFGVGESFVTATHGDVKLSDASANSEIKSSHGKVVVENLEGDLKVNSTHGRVTAKLNGSADVRGSHTDIKLEVTGDSAELLEVKTSHGEIEISVPSAMNPSVDAKTSHGKVKSDFEGESGSDQKLKLRNSHGDIRVRKSL